MSDEYTIKIHHDWKDRLADKLTDDFIHYQYALDFPVASHLKTIDEKALHYTRDYVFRNKVKCLVGQVISRVNESIG